MRDSLGSMSMSLNVSMLSWEPAASAAEGGVGTSSSSMGEGTSRWSEEVPRFSCGWRCRMCCLTLVRTCIGRTPGRVGGGRIGVGTLFVCCMRASHGLLLAGLVVEEGWLEKSSSGD